MTEAVGSGIVPEWTRGDRLRKARSLTGLTTREFAQLIGVAQKTVTDAENDKREKVRKIVLNAWALATEVSVQWLETGVAGSAGPPTPPDPGKPHKLDRLTEQKRSRARTGMGSSTTRRYGQILQPAAREYIPALMPAA